MLLSPPTKVPFCPFCSKLLPVPGLATHLFPVFITLSFPEYHTPAYLGDTAVLGHCNKTNITIKQVTKIWRCLQKVCLYDNVAYMHLILCNCIMSKKKCACMLSHFSYVQIFVYIPWLKNSETSLMVQWLRIHLPCRGHRFDPWSGKIPRVSGQLSPCTAATEALTRALEPVLHIKGSHHNEKPSDWNWRVAPAHCN